MSGSVVNIQNNARIKTGSDRVVFTGTLSEPVCVPEQGIVEALKVMLSGRLFRYGEDTLEHSEVSLLEAEFSQLINRKYSNAVNSCGCALFLALRSLDVKPGDPVLFNSFTLAPVPGAIMHANAKPVLVDITDQLVVDLNDLELKIKQTQAKVFLCSYMRGHFNNCQEIADICKRYNVAFIEDCAHTLGASWQGKNVGTFGDISCFSTQTFKHMNSGEGGIITTNSPEIASRITIMSGSYMYYHQHIARPKEEFFDKIKNDVPNFSMRMSNLTAALLRPQIFALKDWVKSWNTSYDYLVEKLTAIPNIQTIKRDPDGLYVGSSIQFYITGLSNEHIANFVKDARDHGVFLKWFGASKSNGFTSRYDQWGYLNEQNALTNTDKILSSLLDMRIPVSLEKQDCDVILQVLRETMKSVAG